MEARIRELQNPQAPPPASESMQPHTPQTPATTDMTLHQPYGVNSNVPSNLSDSTVTMIQDPPREIAENLYV